MSKSDSTQSESYRPLQKRSIVSCFLFKLCDAEARATKVALFRRSDKVRTYQHYLAPISGSIDAQTDATPVDAAWRELQEETSLTPSTTRLWRKGRPFSFQDETVGREWIIYPFAFLLKPPSDHTNARRADSDSDGNDGDGIVLDWEHDFYNWHDPEQVLSRLEEDATEATVCGQKLVPRIADSLISVYPEYILGPIAGRRLREGLQQLQNDHESGARELAMLSLKILRDILVEVRPSKMRESQGENDWNFWWRNVRLVAWHLLTNGRESMGAAIASALLSVLGDLEVLYRDNHTEDNIDQLIESSIQRRTAMTKRLCEAFDSYVRENTVSVGGSEDTRKKTLRILTLSASSTIRESILHLLKQTDYNNNLDTLDLRVLESRPLFEGVTLASSLLSAVQSVENNGVNDNDTDKSKSKLLVTVYTDSSAALAAKDADILIVGADRIASDGAVSNKTGSLPAILAAKHVSPRTKVLVVSELDKVAEEGPKESHREEDNDAAEVVRGWRLASVKGVDVIDGRLGRKGKDGDVPPARLTVKNIYFEWVPPGLIDAYITDDGVKGVADICERSAWVSQQVRRYFDHL